MRPCPHLDFGWLVSRVGEGEMSVVLSRPICALGDGPPARKASLLRAEHWTLDWGSRGVQEFGEKCPGHCGVPKLGVSF